MAKLRKYLLSFLLIFVALVSFGYLLLRNPEVQNKVAAEAAAWLSKELKTEVKIGKFDFQLFNEVVLTDVLIRDLHKDTLFYFGTIQAHFNAFSNKRQLLFLNHAKIVDGYVNMGMYKGEKDFNYDFFIDYLTPPKPKVKKKFIPFTLRVFNVSMFNTRFNHFNRNAKPYTDRKFDENNLSFSNINMDMRDFLLYGDSLHFNMQKLATKERSGLEIENLSSEITIASSCLKFKNLQLQTNNSLIGDKLEFAYTDYSELSDFVDKVKVNANFNNSYVSFKDIAYFSNELLGNSQLVQLTGKFNGTISNFTMNNLSARIGDDFILEGVVGLKGLPDIKNTRLKADFKQFSTTTKSLNTIFPEVVLPVELNSLGLLGFKGHLEGYIASFNAKGTFRTDPGIVETDLDVVLPMYGDKGSIKGTLKTNEFKGYVFDYTKDVFETIALDAEIDFQGLNEDFTLKIDGKVPQLAINGALFNNIKTNGMLTRNDFKGFASVADARADLSFDGELGFGEDRYALGHAEINYLDLGSLGLKNFGSMKGKIDLNVSGFELETMEASLSSPDLQWTRDGKTTSYKKMSVSLDGKPDARNMRLTSDKVQASASGRFSVAEIYKPFMNQLHHYFPLYLDSVRQSYKSDEILFSLQMPDGDFISQITGQNIKLSPVKILGSTNQNNHHLELSSNVFDIKTQGISVTGSSLNISTGEGRKLNYYIKTQSISDAKNGYAQNVIMQGELLPGFTNFKLEGNDTLHSLSAFFSGDFTYNNDGLAYYPSKSYITIQDSIWNLDTIGFVKWKADEWQFRYFNFWHNMEFIGLHEKVTHNPKDFLQIRIEDFNLKTIAVFLPKGSVLPSGIIGGPVKIYNLLASPTIVGNLVVQDLAFNKDTIGTINLDIDQKKPGDSISFDANIIHGKLNGLIAKGKIMPGKDFSINADVDVPSANPVFINPFVKGIFRFKDGDISTKLKLTGSLSKLLLKGKVYAKNLAVYVDYMNADFYIPVLDVDVDRNVFGIKSSTKLLDDTKRNFAFLGGEIRHEYFKKFTMNIDLNASNFKAINTTRMQNSLYYGTAIIDGTAKFSGPFLNPDIEIRVKSKKGTSISLPIDEETSTGPVSFVSFKEKANLDSAALSNKKAKQNSKVGVNTLDMRMDITPDAELKIIFDQAAGDILKGTGSGNLALSLDAKGQFSLFGDYVLQGGDYNFTAFNIINKKFTLTKGGRIGWTGDPLGARLNIQAEYKRFADPTILTGKVASQSTTTTTGGASSSTASSRVEVVCVLKLSGNLFSPDISFDLNFPNQNSQGTNVTDLEAVLQRLRSNPEEMSRQVISLMTLGTFVAPSYASTDASNQNNALGTTVGEMFNKQLDNLLAQFDPKSQVRLINDLISFERPFFNNKVKVSVSSVYNQNDFQTPNYNVEYSVIEGKFKIRTYGRNNVNSTYNTNVFTQGVGIHFQIEYERSFLRRKPKKKATN